MQSKYSFAQDMLLACVSALILVVAVAGATLPSVVSQTTVPAQEAGTHLT